jgi:hypothetical protein
MSLRDELAEMFGELQRELADGDGNVQTCEFKGFELPCIPSTERRSSVLSVGGFEEVISLTLILLKSDLPEEVTIDMDTLTADSTLLEADSDTKWPEAGRIITFRRRDYRILSVDDPPPGVHFEIQLGSIHK